MWQILQTDEFGEWLLTLNETSNEDIYANVTILEDMT